MKIDALLAAAGLSIQGEAGFNCNAAEEVVIVGYR